jgi:broad specificity phosphatase PhoE
VASVVLIRHAEPLVTKDKPAAQWCLSDAGRQDACTLGTHIAKRWAIGNVWTSPERRAGETAAFAFPSVVASVRHQLSEVKKPWYASAEEHAEAVANYLNGEGIMGWERRDDVVGRIAPLKVEFGSSQSVVLVTHGVFLTIWLDHEVGLGDPFSFWTDLRMPDAWQLDLERKSLERISWRI